MYATLYVFLAIALLTPAPKLHCLNFKEFLGKRATKISDLTYTTRHKQTHFNEVLGLGISLGLATQYVLAQDTKEQENSHKKAQFSIKDLNLKNPQAVLEGFAKATESRKTELAKHVAAGISWYKLTRSMYTVQNISDFLAATTATPHRVLATTIANNITLFTPKRDYSYSLE